MRFAMVETDGNKPFWNDENSLYVVENLFSGARACSSKSEVRDWALRAVEAEGLYLELGVASGRSLAYLAEKEPEKRWFGFDSFEGLPEDWNCGPYVVPKGFFKQDILPKMPPNVELIQGSFSETLPSFLKKHKKQIAFLHMDCDLYSSAKESLMILQDRLNRGAVILFDEFYNYPTCAEHELKAWLEFLNETGKNAIPVAFHSLHEQAAWRIV